MSGSLWVQTAESTFSTVIGNGFTPVVVLRASIKPQTMDAGESRVSAGIGGLRNEVRLVVDAFFVRAHICILSILTATKGKVRI
jgi:hypothetical protein